MLLELALEAAEERESIGRRSGKSCEHLVVKQATHFSRLVFHDRLAERDLAVAGHHDLALMADGEHGCGVWLGHLERMDSGCRAATERTAYRKASEAKTVIAGRARLGTPRVLGRRHLTRSAATAIRLFKGLRAAVLAVELHCACLVAGPTPGPQEHDPWPGRPSSPARWLSHSLSRCPLAPPHSTRFPETIPHPVRVRPARDRVAARARHRRTKGRRRHPHRRRAHLTTRLRRLTSHPATASGCRRVRADRTRI